MAVHQKDQFTFAATGDIILARELLPYAGNSSRFDDLLDVLRTADATASHMDMLFHDYDAGYPASSSVGTYMRSPPEAIDELSAMGIDMFSAASNHINDFSIGGILSTIKHLQERDFTFSGLGKNLFEARQPGYFESPAGRVAIVSATTSYVPGSEAGEQSPSMHGRPGINPLGIEQHYRVHQSHVDSLREVSEAVGFEGIKQEWLDRALYAGHDWHQESFFHLGDMKFEVIPDDEPPHITYSLNENDYREIIEWVEEADNLADWVVLAMHSHEGPKGRWNTAETPEFLHRLARDGIDAGADLFIGTGPHQCRGIEIYKGKPVFYSLGNFSIQSESVPRLAPASFERWHLDDHTKTSQVFDARYGLTDGEDDPHGDLALPSFWEGFVPSCTFDVDGTLSELDLHPITLQRDQHRAQRGIPVLAAGEHAVEILESIGDLSEPYGTTLEIEEEIATISF